MVGRRIHGVAQRGEGTAALSGALPAPPAGRSRVLRPACARSAPAAGGAGRTLRAVGILLLSLLVQRSPVDAASRGGDARFGEARFPLHALLGQRELDAGVGRRRAGGTDPAGVLRGGRPRAHPLSARRGIPRSALHPCRRKAGLRRLPFGALPRHAAHDRGVARGGGRPRRGTLSLPRGEFQRRRTRRAGGRIRRCDRVPALHSCDDRFLGASSVAAEAHVPPAQIVGRPPQDAQSRLRRLRRIQPEPSGPRL